jgi:hypothetical protein
MSTEIQIRGYLTTQGVRFEVTGGHRTKRKDWECFACTCGYDKTRDRYEAHTQACSIGKN